MRCVLPESMSYDVPFKVIVPRAPRCTRASTALLHCIGQALGAHASVARAGHRPKDSA
jgi:hypothetical protein